MNIYTYGSLRLQLIWQHVTGRKHESRPAQLFDHVALNVKGELFPGLIRRDGETSNGAVYLDVDSHSLSLLDQFETNFYERVPVITRFDDGAYVNCQTYRVRPENEDRLVDEPWDFDNFQRHFLDRFIASEFSPHG